MKSFITLIGLLVFLLNAMLAQNFEEFKKQRQAEMLEFREEKAEGLQALQKEFEDYAEKRDKEFAEYLRNEWEQFNLFKGIKPPEKPKPVEAPRIEPQKEMEEPVEKISFKSELIAPQLKPEKGLRLPKRRKSEPLRYSKSKLAFDFYGAHAVFDYDQKMKGIKVTNASEDAIANFWERFSATNYISLIDQFTEFKDEAGLNDWGYYLLVNKAGSELYGNNNLSSTLFTWAILAQSGYKARAGYTDHNIYLLIPSQNVLYSTSFLNIGGLKYYVIGAANGESIYTYKKDFPDANSIFDFRLTNSLYLGNSASTKKIDFNYQGAIYPIELSYNANMIDFYKDYPQSEIGIYFDAAVSGIFKESVNDNFRPIVEGMAITDAADLLLRFVQTSFEYKTDPRQFGYEKFFFAEEALYYPFCDCEDRSVLYSYLLRELLDIEVIGLDFPGHIATAIQIDEELPGDYLLYNNKKYIIADPTYINASLGRSMPDYKGQTAGIIVLKNFRSLMQEHEYFWNLANDAGGYRGHNLKDVIIDEHGDAYLTGYFTGRAKFGDYELNAVDDNPQSFFAKYNRNGEVIWAKQTTGNGFARGFSIERDQENNLYMAGTFQGQMNLEGKALHSKGERPDVYLAKFRPSGGLSWAENAGIDTVAQSSFLSYAALYKSNGKHEWTRLYNEPKNQCEIQIDADEVYLAGAFNSTSGLEIENVKYNSAEEFDPILLLKKENDKFINQKYDPGIAGVFAVVNIMRFKGTEIPGETLQKAMDKYNPGFKKRAESVYENLGKLSVMKNNQGIIMVHTEKGKSLTIDKMKIKDNAQVRVTDLEDGNSRIDVISGINVGKLVVWYHLNNVTLFKNGDLLFDYDHDHSKARVNVEKDILD